MPDNHNTDAVRPLHGLEYKINVSGALMCDIFREGRSCEDQPQARKVTRADCGAHFLANLTRSNSLQSMQAEFSVIDVFATILQEEHRCAHVLADAPSETC